MRFFQHVMPLTLSLVLGLWCRLVYLINVKGVGVVHGPGFSLIHKERLSRKEAKYKYNKIPFL